jgi:8-oxo-dGTP pyrophosphatase MutT (NUDIX family)
MVARGGRQRIPRPPTVRAGGPPPWARLDRAARVLTLSDVRTRCVDLPAPRDAPLVAPGSRAAAVLIPLFDAPGPSGPIEAHVVLTKRPEHLPQHQGEIAFPGGRVEPELDRQPVDAALRETEEEIGLPRSAVEIVAQLDGIATFASRFTITPFVGFLDRVPALVPDPHEVEAILEVPLSELLEDGVFREERWDFTMPPGSAVPTTDRAIHFFDLPGETVWGATARILTGFLTHLTAAR